MSSQSTQEVLAPPLPAIQPQRAAEQGLAADLLVLTKARLTLLVLITTFLGFCMASADRMDWLLLLNTLIGTGLVAACAPVLNQFIEIDPDRLMARTKDRPLPTGRMKPVTALRIGIGMGAAGLLYLALATNAFATALAVATLAIYLFLYTPLKRKTPFCIMVGAVAGAIPPVIGWVAAKPSFGAGAWILFGILFLWQMPHFMAIAWMYHDEYAQAGFVMLRRNDIGGMFTAFESLGYTIALTVVTLLPPVLNMTHLVYLPGAILFNALFLYSAIQFLLRRDRTSSRRLFFTSIIYLPCVLALLVFTRL
jgi:protoheme IX farnesyltransferase